ncbi:alpha/beta hydrolase [Novosphingobium malaysiense]|nr:alpha/beta hydrolase [Novosphingobium malaysiense]
MAEAGLMPMLQQISPSSPAEVIERDLDGLCVFDVTPEDLPAGSGGVVLDLHGGGLFLCGGELCRLMAIGIATRLKTKVWSPDYRMPPDHPYPAALDDAMTAYRALLEQYDPSRIVVHGASAGGNLAAALILRARDEGLAMPAGAILQTPEADLTESGDSFHVNLGVDPGLAPLMPVNLLYANGHDLTDPYLSPLFGDFTKGFPPTILTTGTRDLFLSNTVRMHRALRAADIPAELHVVEAAGHGNFSGAPEGDEIDKEIRHFLESVLSQKTVTGGEGS